jgi:xylulokinase
MRSFLGLDVGTSSVKSVLLDQDQNVIAAGAAPLLVSRPKPLWSEQNPEDWWQASLRSIEHIRSIAGKEFCRLSGIGLSGQMHGATLLGENGQILRPAILWNDGRAGEECHEFHRRVPDLIERCSNIAMPGFTAPKLIWVKRHEPDVFSAIRKVVLPKDYVRYRLTGAFFSDPSDAAGTLWLNVRERRWDDVLLSACDLNQAQMPQLVEGSAPSAPLSADIVSNFGLDGNDIVVAGGGGDNAASAVGIGAVQPGDGFVSVGTSGVIFAVTDRLVADPKHTLHAFCHALPNRWHAMGVCLSAAAALSWAAELVGQQDDIQGLLEKVNLFAGNARNLETAPLFLPYISGERTPHNDPAATGLFADLRADHKTDALIYSVLEGVAFAFADNLAIVTGAGARLDRCMLVGGGARSPFWAQMLADVLSISLDLPKSAEVGAAFGAARLAMIAAGEGTIEAICTRPTLRRRFIADSEKSACYERRLHRFRALYEAEKTCRSRSN